MLEVIITHFRDEIDIFKYKIYIKYTFFITSYGIMQKLGWDPIFFAVGFLFYM